MKKMVTIIVLALLSIQFISAKDVVTKDVNELPARAREIIKEQFPQANISYIKIDREGWGNKTFKVVLTDGVEVEFDNDGNWTEIDCKRKQVPVYFIPASINQFVNSNFNGSYIVQIEKERRGYKVELNNELDLYFDSRGNIRKIDD